MRLRFSRRFAVPVACAVSLSLAGCTVAWSSSPAQRLVFEETFDGPAGSAPDPSLWSAETGGGGWGNDELQSYTARPQNVALDGAGHLVLTARAEPFTGTDGIARRYTSGRVTTKGRYAFTFGRVEARIQVAHGQGLWPAFWLLGSAVDTLGWPEAGEIDVLEMFGSDARAHASVHGPWSEASGAADTGRGWALTGATSEFDDVSSGFHTYAMDWSAGSVRISVDGKQILEATANDVPAGSGASAGGSGAGASAAGVWAEDQPMFLVLNLAVGGRMSGVPDRTTTLPATMLVDSIRVWQR